MDLNGKWTLYYCPEGSCNIDSVMKLAGSGIPSVPCTVPGNVELDLSAAGILPEDLFMGENILEAQKYETYEWWYEREFTAPDAPDDDHKSVLHFGAVDCYAEYYLNGEKFGESDNMFVAQNFDITGILKHGQKNMLHVHISSAIIHSAAYEAEPNSVYYAWHQPAMSINVRKAPHSYGWDIMPRAVSAGLWRSVELRCEKKYDFRYIYFNLDQINGTDGIVSMVFDSSLKPQHIFGDLYVTICGKCGDNSFKAADLCKGGAGRIVFTIPNIKLWWPKNYGEPNMYDITVEVRDECGERILYKELRCGFRTLQLKHSEIIEEGGSFEFIINATRIMAVGSNWVPMDAYHSRDKQRYQKALEMADDIGCNILRCWGGNVYEDHEFFDFCDTHGIMVWQDFSMACHYYPQNHRFMEMLEKEAEWVVKELRGHPSIVLWSGDNEVDSMMAMSNGNPTLNYLTREVLPRIIERMDPCRPYIPSSPFISEKAFLLGRESYPEDHLWGPRDYFKSDFYTGSKAYFVSETGYHGCPARKSIEKFIDPEYVWPYQDNRQWNLHSTDQRNDPGRVMLMHKQVQQLFGDVPTEMDDYILASQISQAEAKKFFIERVRSKMAHMGGVIWWNLVDGWPQMSDAVVDYYYEKKLAYSYIKRSSRPFIIMLDEMSDWGHNVVCANSSRNTIRGTVTISDLDSSKVVFEKAFTAEPGVNTILGQIRLMYSDKGMFLIDWKTEDGEAHFNTYLYGLPAFSLEQYKGWLNKLPKE